VKLQANFSPSLDTDSVLIALSATSVSWGNSRKWWAFVN